MAGNLFRSLCVTLATIVLFSHCQVRPLGQPDHDPTLSSHPAVIVNMITRTIGSCSSAHVSVVPQYDHGAAGGPEKFEPQEAEKIHMDISNDHDAEPDQSRIRNPDIRMRRRRDQDQPAAFQESRSTLHQTQTLRAIDTVAAHDGERLVNTRRIQAAAVPQKPFRGGSSHGDDVVAYGAVASIQQDVDRPPQLQTSIVPGGGRSVAVTQLGRTARHSVRDLKPCDLDWILQGTGSTQGCTQVDPKNPYVVIVWVGSCECGGFIDPVGQPWCYDGRPDCAVGKKPVCRRTVSEDTGVVTSKIPSCDWIEIAPIIAKKSCPSGYVSSGNYCVKRYNRRRLATPNVIFEHI